MAPHTPPHDIDPSQLRPLKCPFCLGDLFEPVSCGPIGVDRLDRNRFQFTPGSSFRCAACLKLFDPMKAARELDQEIFPA